MSKGPIVLAMRRFLAQSVVVAFTALLAAPTFAQVSADGVAATLGPVMALASMCARPTSPIEAELEHYLKRSGLARLRQIASAKR